MGHCCQSCQRNFPKVSTIFGIKCLLSPGCPGCGFPVCGEDSCAPGQLHTAAECEVLARARGDMQYTAITVLR